MENDWAQTTLGLIATKDGYGFIDGPFGSSLPASLYTEHGVPVIRGSNLTLGAGRFRGDEFVFVSEETAKRLERSLCKPSDIVFTKKGTLGQTGLIPENGQYEQYLVSSNQMKLTVDRSLADPLFVYYFVSSPENVRKIIQDSEATGVPKTNLAYLRNFPILLPPLVEQQAIACILGALDAKIEVNRRMNGTLEAMARAIFQDWFVDFGPVRAKAAGQAPAGLAAAVAALFPERLVETKIGETPEGWEVCRLQDQISASKGLSYKGQHLCEPGEGMPLHNLNSVYEGGGYKNEGLKWYNGDFRSKHLVKPGDVIVTNTEQGFDHLLIGYSAIVPKRFGERGLFSHHIYRIDPKSDSYLPLWYFYLLFRTQRFHDIVAGHSNGTTVNMLPADGLQRPLFVVPPRELVNQFDKFFAPTQARIDQIYDENLSLAALRDALLPKLIAGAVRVADAERVVARCL
jgi:type I restriction enzyme S subunit